MKARLFICQCGSWGSILLNSTQEENSFCCPLLKQNNSHDPPSLFTHASAEEDGAEAGNSYHNSKNTCQNCRMLSINHGTVKQKVKKTNSLPIWLYDKLILQQVKEKSTFQRKFDQDARLHFVSIKTPKRFMRGIVSLCTTSSPGHFLMSHMRMKKRAEHFVFESVLTWTGKTNYVIMFHCVSLRTL